MATYNPFLQGVDRMAPFIQQKIQNNSAMNQLRWNLANQWQTRQHAARESLKSRLFANQQARASHRERMAYLQDTQDHDERMLGLNYDNTVTLRGIDFDHNTRLANQRYIQNRGLSRLNALLGVQTELAKNDIRAAIKPTNTVSQSVASNQAAINAGANIVAQHPWNTRPRGWTGYWDPNVYTTNPQSFGQPIMKNGQQGIMVNGRFYQIGQ